MEKPRILVVDDEAGVRESLRMVLKDRYEPVPVASGEEALARLGEERFDAVLLDILMPGIDGLETLQRIGTVHQRPPVVMLTATRTVKTAVEAMKLGAFDYLTKPFDIDELQIVLQRAIDAASLREEVCALRAEVGRKYRFDGLIGAATTMREVLDTVERVAPLKTTVLITGESGTGKEVIARAIHYNSPRAERALVTLNCAAIPDNLLESELFGHERGAFTDAHAKKLGQFEHAHRGTIFLDEIGEMNPATQAKILRVLEQGTFTRVGGSQQIAVDVRVIAATNRDLRRAMQEGTFRQDLYYRLNVVAVHLPPLRERMSDLPALVRHFLQLKSRELGVEEKTFTQDAMDALAAHSWPGNVRELENVVERALALSRGPVLTPEDLPRDVLRAAGAAGVPAAAAAVTAAPGAPAPPPPTAADGYAATLDAAVAALEEQMIRRALAEARNNQTRAAELLGTTRRILKYKMDKLGIADEGGA